MDWKTLGNIAALVGVLVAIVVRLKFSPNCRSCTSLRQLLEADVRRPSLLEIPHPGTEKG